MQYKEFGDENTLIIILPHGDGLSVQKKNPNQRGYHGRKGQPG